MNGLIQTRKCRETGTLISVYDAIISGIETGDENIKYITLCESHDIICGHKTKKDAISWSAQPSMWCFGCQEHLDKNG